MTSLFQKRKSFVSYHHADDAEVRRFVDRFGHVFHANGLGTGISDDPTLVDSRDSEYIIRRIREQYLAGNSVTIVMVGRCTWSRKYVDWEIAATLKDYTGSDRGGLLGIVLPSADTRPASMSPRLPARLKANVFVNGNQSGYGRVKWHPGSDAELTRWIEDAAGARTSRAYLLPQQEPLLRRNLTCGHLHD